MSERKFIELNRKSIIRSEDEISFGAYKDEAGFWNSVGGTNSNFLIERTDYPYGLIFKSASHFVQDDIINDWKTSFRIDTEGFRHPGYGNIINVKTLNNGSTNYTLLPEDNNTLFFCHFQFNIVIPNSSDLPVGYTFYAVKDNVAEATSILPDTGINIYGRLDTTSGDNVVQWSVLAGKKPVLEIYILIYVKKVEPLVWIIGGGIVDQTAIT